jgi:hypothetical protein
MGFYGDIQGELEGYEGQGDVRRPFGRICFVFKLFHFFFHFLDGGTQKLAFQWS